MNSHNCHRRIRYAFFNLLRSDVVCAKIWLDQHRFQSALQDGKDCCDVGIGGNDDLTVRWEIIGFERKNQGVQTRAHANAVLHSTIISELALKTLNLFPKDIPTAFQRLAKSLPEIGKIWFVYLAKVFIFNHNFLNQFITSIPKIV